MKQIVTSEFWRNTKAESSQQENCNLKILKKTNYCIAENWVEDFLANVCGGSPLDLYNCTISIILTIFSIIISHTGLLLTKTLVTLNPIWVAGGGGFISTFQNSLNPIPFCTLSGFHWKMNAFIFYSENGNYVSHVKFPTDFWMKQQGAYIDLRASNNNVWIFCTVLFRKYQRKYTFV